MCGIHVCVERERVGSQEDVAELEWHICPQLGILICTGMKRQERDKSVPVVRKEK